MEREKFSFMQGGVMYNLYDLPKGFVIKGNVNLRDKVLEELPDLSEVTVEGDFDCALNNLTSLQGAPKKVGGNFHCEGNKLTTLRGAPQEIGGNFYCGVNRLDSLCNISKMPNGKEIYCDNEMVQKYKKEPGEKMQAGELYHSTTYQLEAATEIIRRRKSAAEREEQQNMITERKEKYEQLTQNTQAKFDAWLQKNGKTSPEK